MQGRREILVGTVLAAAVATLPAAAQSVKQERSEHPRIAKAIRELEDAIKYMEQAPHDFGGHKQAAIASSKQAVADLRQALAYHAKDDRHRG